MLQFEARVKMTVSHSESAPTFIDACTHLSVLFSRYLRSNDQLSIDHGSGAT